MIEIYDLKTGKVVCRQRGPLVPFGGDWGDPQKYSIIEVPDRPIVAPESPESIRTRVKAMSEKERAELLFEIMVRHLVDIR